MAVIAGELVAGYEVRLRYVCWTFRHTAASVTNRMYRLLHHSQVIQIQGDSYRLKDKRKAGIVGPAREKETVAA